MALVAARRTLAAAESNIQPPTGPGAALPGEVLQLARPGREPGVKVSRMRQKCGGKVQDVLLLRDGRQVHLD